MLVCVWRQLNVGTDGKLLVAITAGPLFLAAASRLFRILVPVQYETLTREPCRPALWRELSNTVAALLFLAGYSDQRYGYRLAVLGESFIITKHDNAEQTRHDTT